MGFEAFWADYVYIYIYAAVMGALKPLGQTMYIYIDAAVMWALKPLGQTMYIYILMLQ